jgi:hypothetical protein
MSKPFAKFSIREISFLCRSYNGHIRGQKRVAESLRGCPDARGGRQEHAAFSWAARLHSIPFGSGRGDSLPAYRRPTAIDHPHARACSRILITTQRCRTSFASRSGSVFRRVALKHFDLNGAPIRAWSVTASRQKTPRSRGSGALATRQTSSCPAAGSPRDASDATPPPRQNPFPSWPWMRPPFWRHTNPSDKPAHAQASRASWQGGGSRTQSAPQPSSCSAAGSLSAANGGTPPMRQRSFSSWP